MRIQLSRVELKEAIYDILKEKLSLPTLDFFEENARLNEDLYMDSIMILQLILYLELDLGFRIPDEMLVPKDFHNVHSLMEFLNRLQQLEI